MRPISLLAPFVRPALAAGLLGAAACSCLAAQTPNAGYHVVREIRLGGDGRWDYIVFDTAAQRLFVARQTRVMVVDPESGKSLGEIPGLDGAHGIALVNETRRGFATSGRDSSVTMFDLKTLRVLARIPAAEDADAVLYDPASKRVLTFNGDAGSSTVIDPASGRAVGSIPLGGKPEFGVSAGDGKVYVNLEDRGRVAEIDPVGMRVSRSWSIAPCAEPTGLAIDRGHHRLFSVCRNRLMRVSDAAAGRAIATVPIGEGVDGAAFDPATGLAFASNGDGSITVVHEDSPAAFSVVATVPTRRGARTMALDPRTHRLFTVTADFGPAPAATAEQPHPRPSVVPGTFTLLVLAP
jgi:DNA-binding beta-propeller fold protein YncE